MHHTSLDWQASQMGTYCIPEKIICVGTANKKSGSANERVGSAATELTVRAKVCTVKKKKEQ